MKNTPTFEEVNNKSSTKKILQNWCKESNIPFVTKDNKSVLKDKLIKKLNLKTDNNDSSGNLKIDFSDDVNKEYSTEKKKKETNLFLMPVTLDELIQYWQRGYVCHPRVIKYLAESSSSNHISSDICNLAIIDLKKNYNSTCEIILELDLNFINNVSIIDQTWMAPLTLLKKIKVFSENQYEIILRSLRNSNRGYYPKDCEIQLSNEKFVKDTYISECDKLDELNVSTKEDFSLIDSLIGGFSISSYIEKTLLSKGMHSLCKISCVGTFYDNIFNNSIYSKLSNQKLILFIMNKIKGMLSISKLEKYEYFDGLMTLVGKRKDREIGEYIFKHHRLDSSKISPFELKRIEKALDEGLIRRAIENIPGDDVRDPILIFYSFLSQFPNTQNPAASDKQSFLFAIMDLLKDELLNDEEAIIVSFFLGFYLGYGMCWNPVIKNEDFEWVGDMSHLQMLFDQKKIDYILKKIIPLTGVKYQYDKSELTEDKTQFIKFESRNVDNRELRVFQEKLELVDEVLDSFILWKRKERSALLLDLTLNYRNELNINNFIKIKNDCENSQNVIKDGILDKLKEGRFTQEERKLLIALIEVI